ncbi:MAG: hypothetical protein U0525_03395 [Patescibacteria group bacterium]
MHQVNEIVDVSHFFLSPLTGISSILQTQKIKKEVDPEKNARALQMIKKLKARIELYQWYLMLQNLEKKSKGGESVQSEKDIDDLISLHELMKNIFLLTDSKVFSVNDHKIEIHIGATSKTNHDDLLAIDLLRSCILMSGPSNMLLEYKSADVIEVTL